MRKIAGFWWPDDVGERWRHSLRHVESLEWSLKRLTRKHTAVQAGGNMGLWPLRMAEAGFARVLSFEPDAISRACLERNVHDSVVEVVAAALGAESGRCSISHKSLGSHKVTAGDSVEIVALDSFALEELDFLQLDVEGYEWHALSGAVDTIRRCQPLIQLELRGFTESYGQSDEKVRRLLAGLGYALVSEQRGNDFVFEAMQ